MWSKAELPLVCGCIALFPAAPVASAFQQSAQLIKGSAIGITKTKERTLLRMTTSFALTGPGL